MEQASSSHQITSYAYPPRSPRRPLVVHPPAPLSDHLAVTLPGVIVPHEISAPTPLNELTQHFLVRQIVLSQRQQREPPDSLQDDSDFSEGSLSSPLSGITEHSTSSGEPHTEVPSSGSWSPSSSAGDLARNH